MYSLAHRWGGVKPRESLHPTAARRTSGGSGRVSCHPSLEFKCMLRICFFAMTQNPQKKTTIYSKNVTDITSCQILSFFGFFNLTTCQSEDFVSRAEV